MIYRIITMLTMLTMLTSCLTVKQIERNCDKFAQICLEEETTTTTIIHDTIWQTKRDTIVEVRLEKDTVENIVYLPSVERSVKSDTSILQTGLATSQAFIYNSRLYHYLESGDTILNIWLNNALVENNRLRKVITDVETVNTVTVLKDTGFGKFAKKWFFGSLILIILVVAGYILKLKKVF